jgi:FMN phosphatase YigB (HAD superfamily)
MNFSPAKAIIFDLGKVLIDFSVDQACLQVAQLVETSPEKIHDFLFCKWT